MRKRLACQEWGDKLIRQSNEKVDKHHGKKGFCEFKKWPVW